MNTRLIVAAFGLTFALSTVVQAQTGNANSNGGNANQPTGYRSATYISGQGATWQNGRDNYGFSGSYGGCQYSGQAGPNGYQINRSC